MGIRLTTAVCRVGARVTAAQGVLRSLKDPDNNRSTQGRKI